MFFLFSDSARFVLVTWDIFFQVFINYGPLPNNRLLRLYGFVLSSNPNDSYDIVLSTHPTAPFWEQKQKLWISAGLDSTCTISSLSPIRYRKMSFDTSVFSDWTNRISPSCKSTLRME